MLVPLAILAIFLRFSHGASPQQSFECGACFMVLNETTTRILAADPTKKIDVGSFRVSPDGQQKGIKQVSYSRSDEFLFEILDDICTKSSNYYLTMNKSTGKLVYSFNSNVPNDKKTKKIRADLRNACDDFLDSQIDEIVKFLKNEHDEPIKQFCQIEKGICSAVDVTPFPIEEIPEEPLTLADIPEDEL
ncbi:unnamed protein product [Caenorhabditis angaria]|uniref:DUF3456 domain-containing protein n=1 Tax=Caenorhabditis angaria TaxID=860376 RepID=A0A9P1MZP0_9PELO|nr:unnamed protein product [Caenorhabditis angaria]